MSTDTDKMRRATDGLELRGPFASPMRESVAQVCDGLRAGADEIDHLRAALRSVDPRPAERMMWHRRNAATIVAAQIAKGEITAKFRTETIGGLVVGTIEPVTDADVAARVEALAHALYAAERPPAATVAAARPEPGEAQAWIDAKKGASA